MANSEYNLTVVDGTALTISLSGPVGPAGAGGGTVDATIIDGSTNAVSGNAVFDALALKAPLASPTLTGEVVINTLVGVDKKSLTINNTSIGENNPSYGIQITKSGATSIGIKVAVASSDGVGIESSVTGSDAIGITQIASGDNAKGAQIDVSGDGCKALVLNTTGTNGQDASGLVVNVTGDLAVGAAITTATGTNHATFGSTGINQSFVARVKGAFGWIRGSFTGRIHPPDTLTADRIYVLPDDTGTVALTNPFTGTQTFTGTQIFSSTTRPTSSGSGTPTATSLITLADAQSLRWANLMRQITPDFSSPNSVSANGGTFDASGAIVRSRSGITGAGANSISKSFALTVGASGGGGINFNLPIEFHAAWLLASGGRITEAKYYLCFGRTHNAGGAPAPMTDPDKHTIGLVIDNGAVKLITHNGTTLTTSATLFTITDPLRVYYTRIRSDGAGNVSLFVDFSDTATATITGGPTTTSAAGWMVFSCQQTTTNLPTTQAQLLINACHVLLNP